MAGNGSLMKTSLNQITSSSTIFILVLVIGLLNCAEISSPSISANNTMHTNHTHYRHHPNKAKSGKVRDFLRFETDPIATPNTPIGQSCTVNSQCTNSSICLIKEFEDKLKLKVCQCDPIHMNRVGNSCFVKPGHQCYFPNGDDNGQRLLNCMKETECRSGVIRSTPGNAYCMCKDIKEDEPFRPLIVDNEIRRCAAHAIFPSISQGLFFFIVFTFNAFNSLW